jgi:hypothetical protein
MGRFTPVVKGFAVAGPTVANKLDMLAATTSSGVFFSVVTHRASCYEIPMDRETFPDDDLEPILPRPLFPEPTVAPAPPPVHLPEPREIAPRGIPEKDGPTRDEILLTALTIVARREPQTEVTRGAMRDLIRRHSVECGLGF